MISASLFSNPSRRSLENGRLLGSAQTASSGVTGAPERNGIRSPMPTAATIANAVAAVASHSTREDIEHASHRRGLLDVGNRTGDAERGVRIVGGNGGKCDGA